MSELEETNNSNVIAFFNIKNMPLATFKRFKRFSDGYNGNYAISIKVLLDKADTLDYVMGADSLKIEEVEDD